MKILHITPHTGGGVGTVILNWILKDKSNEHCLMLLGYADERTVRGCYENNIRCYEKITKDFSFLHSKIEDADIVIIHYWNHPLLLNFLVNNKLPECRLITWFHNSGFYAPYTLPEQMIKISDKFVFTSPISYQLEITKKFLKEKFTDIWTTGGIEKYINVKHKDHEGFNILYIGTLDFSKIRSDFIFICSQIIEEIQNVKIHICGDGCDIEEMMEQVRELGLIYNISFHGFVNNIIPYLETADCFLYLLNSHHYGTCEQVLGEAMSCGIVPIVFDNPCEKEIVKDIKNGFIVNTIEDCINIVKLLSKDAKLREELSKQARIDAIEKYSIDKMIDKWNILFNEIIKIDKIEKQWNTNYRALYGIGAVSFMESLNEDKALIFHKYISYERQIENIFRANLQWMSLSKGSINQYLKYFPNDKYLKKFKRIIDEKEI